MASLSLKLSTALMMLMVPVTALGYGKRPIGNTRTMTKGSTTGMYLGRQVWLPGSWIVNQSQDTVTFTRVAPDGRHQSVVKLLTIPKNTCAYGLIRIRSLKAWGGSNLEQSQAKIEAITLGTSKYKGYTWVEPSKWAGDRHWCLGQDMKSAVEIVAPIGEPDIVTFARNDLLLQLAVRNGRSVLPWPQASTQHHSSMSASSAASASSK